MTRPYSRAWWIAMALCCVAALVVIVGVDPAEGEIPPNEVPYLNP